MKIKKTTLKPYIENGYGEYVKEKTTPLGGGGMSAQGHPLVFNERGNLHKTGQAVVKTIHV